MTGHLNIYLEGFIKSTENLLYSHCLGDIGGENQAVI